MSRGRLPSRRTASWGHGHRPSDLSRSFNFDTMPDDEKSSSNTDGGNGFPRFALPRDPLYLNTIGGAVSNAVYEVPQVPGMVINGLGNWMGGIGRRHALMPGKGRWAKAKDNVKWDPHFTSPNKKRRRVLMVEYLKTDITEGDRKIVEMKANAVEFDSLASIEALCSMDRKDGCILRVFHVQNFPEAVEFFVLKYRMHDRRNTEGWDDFKEWAYHFRPTKRAGKPVPMAKTFKKKQLPGLAKVAWGMDCLKVKRVRYRPDAKKERHPDTKIAELKGFLEDDEDEQEDARGIFKPENPWDSEDEEREISPHWSDTDPMNPRRAHHTHDVYIQRLSVFLQWVTTDSKNRDSILPGNRPARAPTDIFDPGSTIIVLDNSETLSIEDTVIPAHGETERIWRGPGTSYYDSEDIAADGQVHSAEIDAETTNNKFALDFIQRIVETIYNSVAECWEAVLDIAWDHESILQDTIFEHPADESRAPELFKNSETWLKFSKLMSYHLECIGDVQEYAGDFHDEDDVSEAGPVVFTWLKSVEQTFQRLNGYIEEDLIKQTDKLTDLMYKSVGIRDSQDSLRLGTSMWRLSWVTFIFLPLTFITGFFGMNVDTFENDPSIKWYFITAVPFMCCVLIFVFILKWAINRHRRPIYERGVYERLFQDLQAGNSDLWSSQGPREIVPIGLRSKFQWWLVYHLAKGRASYQGSTLSYDSMWDRFKKYIITTWSQDVSYKMPECGTKDGEKADEERGRGERQRSGLVDLRDRGQPLHSTYYPAEPLNSSSSSLEARKIPSYRGEKASEKHAINTGTTDEWREETTTYKSSRKATVEEVEDESQRITSQYVEPPLRVNTSTFSKVRESDSDTIVTRTRTDSPETIKTPSVPSTIREGQPELEDSQTNIASSSVPRSGTI